MWSKHEFNTRRVKVDGHRQRVLFSPGWFQCVPTDWKLQILHSLLLSISAPTKHQTAEQRPPAVLLVISYSGCVTLSTEHTGMAKNRELNITTLLKYEKTCSKLSCFTDQINFKWDWLCASCWISYLLPHMLIFSLCAVRTCCFYW